MNLLKHGDTDLLCLPFIINTNHSEETILMSKQSTSQKNSVNIKAN